MSTEIRRFVKYLVKQIENESTLGDGYTNNERTRDVIDMIWLAYDQYIINKNKMCQLCFGIEAMSESDYCKECDELLKRPIPTIERNKI